MSSPRKPTKRKSPQELLAAIQERLDATPERLARAKEAGETPFLDADRTRRMLDPFDTMRANRLLAPTDPKLNDIRWLVGESLRRTHQRARMDQLRAVSVERFGAGGFGPRPGLPQSEAALHARDKLRAAEDRAARLADRDAYRHRGGGCARLPRLRSRTRHPLAGRCGRLRPPAGGARHARRAHGDHEA
jgi:hypothetical protein